MIKCKKKKKINPIKQRFKGSNYNSFNKIIQKDDKLLYIKEFNQLIYKNEMQRVGSLILLIHDKHVTQLLYKKCIYTISDHFEVSENDVINDLNYYVNCYIDYLIKNNISLSN